jgi:hypothetical protein
MGEAITRHSLRPRFDEGGSCTKLGRNAPRERQLTLSAVRRDVEGIALEDDFDVTMQ